MLNYPQIGFDLAKDGSKLIVYLAGTPQGTVPIDGIKPPPVYVLNEDGSFMLDENGNKVLAEQQP